MSQGQGNISFTTKTGTPAGFINVAGARNGLTVDGSSYIVLGQSVGAVGNPGMLLNNREIPLNGFGVQWDATSNSTWSLSASTPAIQTTFQGTGTQRLAEIITIQGQNPLPGQPYGNFWWTLDESFVNPDGQRDAVIAFGYNQDGAGHRVVPNEAAFATFLESHFERAGIGTFEYYLQAFCEDGTTARHFAIDANKNTASATGFQIVENWQYISIADVTQPYVNYGPGVANFTGISTPQTISLSSLVPGSSTMNIVTSSDGSGDNTFNGTGVGRWHFQGGAMHVDSPGPGDGYDFLFRNSSTNSANHLFDIVNHSNKSVLSIIENTGNLLLNNDTYNLGIDTGQQLQVIGNAYVAGNIGIGETVITARLHLAGGTAIAGSAPIKLTAGPLLVAVENGTFEFDGTHLYFTIGAVRNTIV